MLIFLLGFEIGPGPLFYVLAAESFPDEVRDPALPSTRKCQNSVLALGDSWPTIRRLIS